MSDGLAGDVAASSGVSPIASNAGLTTRVVGGTLWTLGGQAVILLSALVATPFIVRLLGSESYGVLALINVVVGYLAFGDMGMGLASTRFGAEAHALGDDKREAAVVWTALVIGAMPAAVCAALLALFAAPLVEQGLRLPEHLRAEAVIALRLAGVIFFARTAACVFNTSQLVRMRMDLNILISAGTAIAQNVLIPVLLFSGGNLVTAVAVMVFVSIAAALIDAVVSMRLQPLLIRPKIKLSLVKPLVVFGGGLVVSALAAVFLANAEKLLLTRFASVKALAYYSIAFSVSGMLTVGPAAMKQSLLPTFTRLQGEPQREALTQLYTRVLRGTALWVAPAALLLCVVARPFFTVWAGPEFGRESTLPFYILVGGVVFGVMAYVPQTLLMAFGRSALIARIHLAELLPYTVCAAALTYWLGAAGAALAWSARLVVDALLFFNSTRRITGLGFSPFALNRGSYTTALATLLLPVALTAAVAPSPILLAVVTALSLLTYAFVIWRRVLAVEERAWLIELLLKPKRSLAVNSARAY